ncbi:propionate catabolism operon regulatory protein PrpR [Rhodocyclaceae bacterium SMB388]
MNPVPRYTSGRGLPRVCFLGYRHLTRLVEPILGDYADRMRLEVTEGAFEQALAIARQRIEAGEVDAFVSAGANASILRSELDAPVATIQVEGFDILQAMIRARRITDRVGIVTYGQTNPRLDAVKDLLKMEIAQYAYQTAADAQNHFDALRRDGFEVIIGSSLVIELAERCGLQGLLVYSLDSVRRGLESAIDLARAARLESGRYEQLNGVVRNLQDAMLAVDHRHRIIAINPPMQRVLGREGEALLGTPLDALDPELSLLRTLETGEDERATVRNLMHRDWVMNRTPIREHGEIVGAAITLYDAHLIQEADTSLRILQRTRQTGVHHGFDDLIGNSPAFVRAVATARRFAQTDLTVLLTGESGVGKELFAQAIHNASPRAGQAFVALNCAAFPEALLESELFGYEEGAFTGSRRGGKRGLLEAAHKGSLFLDEIGDMPLALQTRLLRVLQEREVTRLGGTTAVPIDVRIIVATHQPLQQMITERRFRQDLYYRINTLRLEVPPLRERHSDIQLLARTLLARSLRRLGSTLGPDPVMASLAGHLKAYPWPGNVRELENIAERIAVFLLQFGHEDEVVLDALAQDCPELFPDGRLHAADDGDALSVRIDAALKRSSGNRSEAARLLGISRATLWRWQRHLQKK